MEAEFYINGLNSASLSFLIWLLLFTFTKLYKMESKLYALPLKGI
jgi:hypothetical protein